MDDAKLTLRIARSTQATYERHVQDLRKLVAEKQRALKYVRRQAEEARFDTQKAFDVLTELCNVPPTQQDLIQCLPLEMLLLICSFLDYADRVRFASCCKFMRPTRVTPMERWRFIQENARGLKVPGSGPTKKCDRHTVKGKLILAGLQARYPGTDVYSIVCAYDGDDVRAYQHVMRVKTKLVWGQSDIIVQGIVTSVKKHPVLPVVVALAAQYDNQHIVVVWDGQKKWRGIVGKPLAPLYVEGSAVRFHTDANQYII